MNLSPEAVQHAARHFDPQVLARGLTYAKENRVQIIKGLPFPVVAKVRGTLMYVVSVNYDSGSDSFYGDCSCPVGDDCKHAAAVAVVALAMLEGDVLSAAQRHQAQQVASWLADLGCRGGAPAQAPTNKVLVYVVGRSDGWGKGRLAMGLWRTTRLKRGGFGRASRLGSGALDAAPSWFQEEDIRLIAYMRTASHAHPYTSEFLAERLPSKFWQEVAATGRLFWQEVAGLPLSWASGRKDSVAFCDNGEGEFQLGLSSGHALITGPSCHYVDTTTRTMGPVDVGVDSQLLSRLVTGPGVPKSMLPTVQASLKAVLPTEATGDLFGAEEATDAKPVELQPFVRLEVDRRSLLLHTLAFYGDEAFPLGKWHSGCTVVRNFSEEGRLAERLKELVAKGHCRLDWLDSEALLTEARYLAQSVLPTLSSEGWLVEVAESVPVQMPILDAQWVEELRPMSDGHDWFELGIGVNVAGNVVPLLPILLQALRDKKLKLDTLSLEAGDLPGITLPLPNGDLVHVAPEQLQRWLRPLVELRLRGLNKDEALVLPAVTAVALADATPGVFSSQKALQTVRKRLEELVCLQPKAEAKSFQGELRNYQRQGLAWLAFLHASGYGGILADDMGLGKTVQLLAFIESLRTSRKLPSGSPVLVVAPRSVVGNWALEAARFTPKLTCSTHLGASRTKDVKELISTKLVLTSYQTLLRDIDLFAEVGFTTIIFDEAQSLKNPTTKLRRGAARLKAQSRFCVTGTPMENHLGELWSQVDLVMPGILGSRTTFATVFRTPVEKYGNGDALELLRQRIRPFLLRRTKATVDIDLPEKTTIVETIALDTAQRDLYESLRLILDKQVRDALNARGVEASSIVILDALLRLRQCCCDPRLVKIPEANKAKTSAKLERLMTMLDELADSGRFVLVFSQFTSMLDLIAQECDKSKIPYLKLTGATRNRQDLIDRFQRGEVPVFLISLKAGGVGLNLTRADTVIHYDPWWNPAAEEQATDRAHRIGQTQNVMVYKLVAANTVEERICVLQKEKQHLTDATLHKGGLTHFGAEDLRALFQSL